MTQQLTQADRGCRDGAAEGTGPDGTTHTLTDAGMML